MRVLQVATKTARRASSKRLIAKVTVRGTTKSTRLLSRGILAASSVF